MSLDGCITGPNVTVEEPMGHEGDRMHDWMFAGRSGPEVERFQTSCSARSAR